MALRSLGRNGFWTALKEGSLFSLLPQRSLAAAPATAPDSVDVFINDNPLTVPKGYTVIQACDAAGIDIPRFCYHQKLSIAGNCRMCLVEVEKITKPVASCAMPVSPGMRIKTESPMVKKAREGVMEFLLLNHPLDCPICDQGGECDLQDQSMEFGSDRGRFTEIKRTVSDKNLGPLVKTVMTRCIHCTRCVRFAEEVAGVEDLGVTGRGRDSEVGTYVSRLMKSELSGNVIDLCPVGALTSKPYAFTARPWELKNTESIDISDALGANVKIDSRGLEVMRISPRLNEEVNEEWLSDKARFQYDGLRWQRLNLPMIKGEEGLKNTTWKDALFKIKDKSKGLQGNEIKAIAGKLTDAESMVAMKDLMNRLGSGNIVHEALPKDVSPDVRSSYIANSSVAGLDEADMILLIGTNPRVEAPVFNARIRKAYLNGVKISLVGQPVDLTYPYQHLGKGLSAVEDIAAGSPILEEIKSAQRPMIIVGSSVLFRKDRDAVLAAVFDIAAKGGVVKEGWNGYNLLHDFASSVAALDLGFVPSVSARKAPPAKFVYLLGSDDFADEEVPDDAFVVYQGHHGEKGAARADVVLPGAAYTEKTGTYVNFEGRVQRTFSAVPTIGDARDDWKIVRALSEILDVQLPYDDLDGVRSRLSEIAPHFAHFNKIQPSVWLNGSHVEANLSNREVKDDAPLQSSISNFFMTDVISRTSRTMAKCVQAHAAEN